eukprot:1161664-Pelagomonas_calceolata.AAC.18
MSSGDAGRGKALHELGGQSWACRGGQGALAGMWIKGETLHEHGGRSTTKNLHEHGGQTWFGSAGPPALASAPAHPADLSSPLPKAQLNSKSTARCLPLLILCQPLAQDPTGPPQLL